MSDRVFGRSLKDQSESIAYNNLKNAQTKGVVFDEKIYATPSGGFDEVKGGYKKKKGKGRAGGEMKKIYKGFEIVVNKVL